MSSVIEGGQDYNPNAHPKYEQPHSASLRDYFAAKALQGFWASPDEALSPEQTREQFRKEMCGVFYEWADSMLKEREK